MDDVPRCSELPVLPGASDLAEHVLVYVTLRVTFLHWHLVKQVHYLGEKCRSRNGEARVFHVLRVGGVGTTELPDQISAQIGEDVLPHHREHFGGGEVLEAGPTEVLVGPTLFVLAVREDAPLHRFLEPARLVLLQRVHVVEPTKEQQVGDLLHHL